MDRRDELDQIHLTDQIDQTTRETAPFQGADFSRRNGYSSASKPAGNTLGPDMHKRKSQRTSTTGVSMPAYGGLLQGVVELLEEARRFSARSINAVMTATYLEVGRRIVEFEQGGKTKPAYGEEVINRLAEDLKARFGRGFSRSNVFQMRQFYLAYREKVQTLSGQSTQRKIQTPSGLSRHSSIAGDRRTFPLPWSHYVRLLSIEHAKARAFYEAEALRGGWSVRQLDRQISTLFYERTAHGRDKAAMLTKGERAKPGETLALKRKSKTR